ncbi:hypothetical protein P5V15_014141 [Pogonomyrmex californicus]
MNESKESAGCKICKAKHNSLLHRDSVKENESHEELNQDTSGSIVSTHCTKDLHQVLPLIHKVYVFDKQRRQHECRVLLDPGSQSNLITQVVDKLHLVRKFVNISGINQSKTRVSQSIVLEI